MSERKMKAVIKAKPERGIQIADIPVPEISAEEVLIQVEAVGICGSDVHIWEWTPAFDYMIRHMPVVLGHEFAGEVVDVGNQVVGVRTGDKVIYQGGSCGQCYYCSTGQHALCDQRRTLGRIGLERKGGMAEYVVINPRQNFLPKIPAGISFEEAALCQPTAEAFHILEKGGFSPGDPVVVLGCGAIGVVVAHGAKFAGACPVIVTGLNRDKDRLAIAHSLGADCTINVEKEDPVEKVKALTGGLGAITVFEVSGSPKALTQGLELLRKGGTLVAFGLYPENISVDIVGKVVREMKVIRGVSSASRLAWSKGLALMAGGRIRVAPLITHRLPLERAEEGFRLCHEGKAMKVILYPGQA